MTAKPSESLEGLLAFALAFEDTMAWIYRTGAALTVSDETRAALKQLQQAEEQHARAVAALAPGALAPGRSEEDSSQRWTVSRIRKTVIPALDLSSLRGILVTAYRLERGGGVLYWTLVDRAEPGPLRELAETLAGLEEVHCRVVAEQFALAFGGQDVLAEPDAETPLSLPVL